MPTKEYLSCEYLEYGLNIYKDSLTHCCVAHSDGKGDVKIGPFSGESLPMETIRQAKKQLIEDNQTEAETPCTGCHMLVKKRWKSNPGLKFVTINDFYSCNLRCQYCYTRTESGVEHLKRRRSHDTLALVEDMVARGLFAKDATVYWGGGEVAIYDYFEPIAKLLNQHGISQLVNTNAVVFSPVIEEGLSCRGMVVQISVDAGTAETFHQIKGVDAFEVVWKHLARYAQAGDLQVKYIVMQDNNSPEDVNGFLEQCRRAGVGEIVVAPESGEMVRRAISPESLEAAAAILAGGIAQKMVVNDEAFDFGEFYKPLVSQRLAQCLAEQHGLNPRRALFQAKLRRHGKRVKRGLRTRFTPKN